MSKNIIHKLLGHGAKSGANSLVINRLDNGLNFNYKFDDESEQNFSLPASLGQKILENFWQVLKISEDKINPKQVFKLREKNYQIDFNLSIVSNKAGEKIIVRILKKNQQSLSLKQLGFQIKNLNILKKGIKARSGLIIISSPEANGKTTSLQALIKEIDTETINAYFLENNPGTLLPNINYLKNSQNNWDKILGHDSDLIIIDDLENDLDLIKAIKAATTGRLVIIAIQAYSSLEIVLRILKLDLPPTLKINSLKIIVNQRLVDLNRNLKTNNKFSSLGMRSKIAISEVIDFDKKIKKYLIENADNYNNEIFWKNLNDLIVENGFEALKNDLAKKVKNGSVKNTIK